MSIRTRRAHALRWLLAPLLLLATVPALAPAAVAAPPAAGVKAYGASASPTVVPLPAPEGASVSVVLRNCGSCPGVRDSSQSFASARLSVPVGAGLDLAAATVSRTGWSVRPATVVAGSVVVTFVSTAIATTSAVQPGQALLVRVPVVRDAVDGIVPVTTAVKQSNDFSGEGNDFARAGADPTVHLGAGPAVGLAFETQPSTVQVTGGTAVASPGVTPVLSMCPAPTVRVVDAGGTTVRSAPPTTVTLAASSGAPALGGTLTAVTSQGVATFGTCAAGVTAAGLGSARMTASAPDLTASAPSSAFSVLPTYGACPGACSVGSSVGPAATSRQATTAALQAAPQGGASGADRLSFGVGVDAWSAAELAACDPDPDTAPQSATLNPFRDVVVVDLPNHDKTVQLRWTKQAVQWATNNGSSQWRVCLAAEAPFQAAGGAAGELPIGPDGRTWWVGVLLPCATAQTPDNPCLLDLRRNGGEQLATVRIPDRPGDPRMI